MLLQAGQANEPLLSTQPSSLTSSSSASSTPPIQDVNRYLEAIQENLKEGWTVHTAKDGRLYYCKWVNHHFRHTRYGLATNQAMFHLQSRDDWLLLIEQCFGLDRNSRVMFNWNLTFVGFWSFCEICDDASSANMSQITQYPSPPFSSVEMSYTTPPNINKLLI
jgi:hypothetical protein